MSRRVTWCTACNPMLTGDDPAECGCPCHMPWPAHPWLPHDDGLCFYCLRPQGEHAPTYLVAR